MLGRWFNKFVEGMQNMVKEIFGISREVSAASRQIESSSREIAEAVKKQIQAAEDTSSSIKEMDASIKTVAEEAEALRSSSREVSDSVNTMSNSVEDVKVNIDKLFISSSSTNSSINEIAVSINQVASHVDELFRNTEEVVSSIIDISDNVKEVETYARSQAELAEKVRVDAEDLGMASVVKTREGIEKVSEEVASTSLVVNRLGERFRCRGKAGKGPRHKDDSLHQGDIRAHKPGPERSRRRCRIDEEELREGRGRREFVQGCPGGAHEDTRLFQALLRDGQAH
jgi:methyl-accepting chemotaxis protein